ncbi:MAG TPA: hypothetical protein VJ385_02805 [Fibrobacteria bacterium]|nr:hypothetical protein [Fibrobacteria bacterium]
MGAKPIFSLPFSRRSAGGRVAAAAFAVAFSCCLSACISDGPNKTGGEYLSQNGILLENPLYHLSLKGVPVDSFWTTDLDGNHLGDSILLAGHSGDFSAEARFAFQLTDTSMLDSLAGDDSTTLKLSLGFPPSRFALEELKATVDDSSKTTQDSIRFQVSAWETTDTATSDAQWAQRVAEWNRRYVRNEDTLAALPEPSTVDTITLAVKDAYAHPSQARALPRLRKRLLASMRYKHLIQIRLSPIFGTPIDSGAAMLRLGGQQGDGSGLTYGPLLLFGKRDSATGAPAAARLPTLYTNSGLRGVNYSVRYTGPEANILTGKWRGLHVILDRKALLDSIDADLRRQNRTPQPHPASGDFDVAYFVPFAKLTLPLAGSALEGNFPLEIKLISSADSLLGDETNGAIKEDRVPLEKAEVLWNSFEPGNPGKIRNDVKVAYRTVDSTLRRVELAFSQDSSLNDTVFLAVGQTKQLTTTLSGYPVNSFLTLKVEAGTDSLTVRSYLTAHPGTEPGEFRDPATGETITEMEKRVKRFLYPKQTELTLRATNGIQRMLNRTRSNKTFLPDFQFQPAFSAAIDTSVDLGSGNIPAAVPYPVLSVVSPKLEGNRLKVDVELYLFPLKAR